MMQFRTTSRPDSHPLTHLLTANPNHPHIHTVDMPYRLTATWQDHGCEIGVWEDGNELMAWALFNPPWWNLDYVVRPSVRGTSLEKEIFSWGVEQMQAYSKRTGYEFWGSVSLFEDVPKASTTLATLTELGFQPFDWGVLRFERELGGELEEVMIPAGFTIRSLKGQEEVDAYVQLHRQAFNSDIMTTAWRSRVLQHPAYRPDLDLVIESSDGTLVGFCIGWVNNGVGQIEPLGVHPNYQGMGLGKVLEQTAFRRFSGLGIRRVLVDHNSFNESAIALSQKSGFRQTNNALRYYVDIGAD